MSDETKKTSIDPGDGTAGNEEIISSGKYASLTGESLGATLNIDTWEGGVRALQSYERLEREIEAAERIRDDLRRGIRSNIFEMIASSGGPPEADVRKVTIDERKKAQRDVLFNGLDEG